MEVKDRAEVLLRHVVESNIRICCHTKLPPVCRPAPHRTNSASSVGIIMHAGPGMVWPLSDERDECAWQLTRVLWDELLPQLEQSPKASPQVRLV